MLRANQLLSYFIFLLSYLLLSNSTQFQPPVTRNPDGTYTRHVILPTVQANPDITSSSPVLSKDVMIKSNNETWFRIHLPRQALNYSSSTNKFPLIVYFHGGAFILFSAATSVHHDFCTKMAFQLNAIVVNVEYRLAPEHRLPAAYNDALEALQKIKNSQDVWLKKYADFSNTFLYGISAGANIAYNAALGVSKKVNDFQPLKINGLILHHPFFGGVARTGSELSLSIIDPILSLPLTDFAWDHSLPEGANRDHEYCNPMVSGGSNQIRQFQKLGWRVLVACANQDMLIDRQKEFVRMLEAKCVRTVVYRSIGTHGVEETDDCKADTWFKAVKGFVSSWINSLNEGSL